jgi:hypothetical protein
LPQILFKKYFVASIGTYVPIDATREKGGRKENFKNIIGI